MSDGLIVCPPFTLTVQVVDTFEMSLGCRVGVQLCYSTPDVLGVNQFLFWPQGCVVCSRFLPCRSQWLPHLGRPRFWAGKVLRQYTSK